MKQCIECKAYKELDQFRYYELKQQSGHSRKCTICINKAISNGLICSKKPNRDKLCAFYIGKENDRHKAKISQILTKYTTKHTEGWMRIAQPNICQDHSATAKRQPLDKSSFKYYHLYGTVGISVHQTSFSPPPPPTLNNPHCFARLPSHPTNNHQTCKHHCSSPQGIIRPTHHQTSKPQGIRSARPGGVTLSPHA